MTKKESDLPQAELLPAVQDGAVTLSLHSNNEDFQSCTRREILSNGSDDESSFNNVE